MKQCLIAVLFLAPLFSAAAYNGSVNFSQADKNRHKRKIKQFTRIGKECLERYKAQHLSFYRSHCIGRTSNGTRRCLSKFYGDRRYSKKRGARRSFDNKPLTYLGDALRTNGFPLEWMGLMESTSCVGMALSCLAESFRKTGQANAWTKIERFVGANGTGGTALQHGLRQIGWRVFYWNPAHPSTIDEDTKRWDEEEKEWLSKGHHNYRYRSVMNRNRYWFNVIDDKETLVGFEKTVPNYIYGVPFWIGTANTGYHVFPGTHEKVVEAHSTRHITSISNLEFSDFAPFVRGGGPRWTAIQKYRSGMIAVPPTY